MIRERYSGKVRKLHSLPGNKIGKQSFLAHKKLRDLILSKKVHQFSTTLINLQYIVQTRQKKADFTKSSKKVIRCWGGGDRAVCTLGQDFISLIKTDRCWLAEF